MRRTILMLAVVPLVLMVTAQPAAAGGPPVRAEGSITWNEFAYDEPRPAGPNTFFTGMEGSVWTGSFVGTATDTFFAFALVNGDLGAQFWFTFEGAVGDAEGTLVMRMTYWARSDGAGGQWVITRGTGELAGLRGRGTWTITGGTETEAYADYSGQMLFT